MLWRTRTVLAALSLAGLVACHSPAPPAVAPAIVLPSPSGAVPSIEDAAVLYQQIVAPFNTAANQLYDDIDRHVDWRKVKQQTIALADIREQEAMAFAAVRWPADIAGYVDEMVRRATNSYTILYTARDADTPDELSAVLDKAATQDSCPTATLIRAKLKLPPPIPPCVDASEARG